MQQELDKMINKPTVKENIEMFNKKIAKAEMDKAMKKVSASLQKIKD